MPNKRTDEAPVVLHEPKMAFFDSETEVESTVRELRAALFASVTRAGGSTLFS